TQGGRVGEQAATGLSGCLARLGLEMGRLKTGTPPRLQKQSIDFHAFEIQPGDAEPLPFSYLHEAPASRISNLESRISKEVRTSNFEFDSSFELRASSFPWSPP